jgi:hypothetical protein
MNKATFLQLMGKAYHFPDCYGQNLDAADEILGDMAEESETPLSLRPLFEQLLAEARPEEREQVWALLRDYFKM